MHPATRLAHRLGDDVHERGHVVVCHLLPLLDCLDRERCALADLGGLIPSGTTPCFTSASTTASSTSSQVSSLRCSDHTAPISGRVYLIDHESRIRAARTAAFLAESTPTQATGTPGGIWVIASSASSPPATDVRDERHADHR